MNASRASAGQPGDPAPAVGAARPGVGERMLALLDRHLMGLVTVAALISYALIYLSNCFGPTPIRADGAGYYAYLPSLLIHHDASGESLAQASYGGEIPEWTGLKKLPETGCYANKYNMGVAVLLSPFFLAAHVGTWLLQSPVRADSWWQLNYPQDGYSLFYQHAAGLSGLFYFLVGLALLNRLLAHYFTRGVRLATLALLLLGTNLYHYGTAESVFATPYSFCLFCAFLLATRAWYEQPGELRRSLVLGAVAGLIALVRVNNALFGVVFLLYGIGHVRELGPRLRLLLTHARPLAAAGALAALILLPQLLMWRHTTGHWLSYSYRREGFDWLHPHLWQVLYHIKRGLFFYCPALLLALPGLAALRRHARPFLAGALVYLPLQWYVVASWWQWWWGGSLGHRAFIESYGLFALAIASFLASLRTRRERVLVAVFALAAIGVFLFYAKLYYTREMPYQGLDGAALYDVLYLRRDALRAWWH